MIEIHDATPLTTVGLSELPVIDRLAESLGATRATIQLGESGRTTAYCLERMAWRGQYHPRVMALREALAAGLVRALSVFPAAAEFQTGDADGMLCVNEDGTRGAVLWGWHLHPLNHRSGHEAEMEGYAFRQGGGIPDVD